MVHSKYAKKKQANGSGGTQPIASGKSQDSAKFGSKSSRRAAALKKRVITASLTPELPSTHRKPYSRPAGITFVEASSDQICPNVVHNIAVVCTDKEANARKLLTIKRIRVNGKEHEVAVYAATKANYYKGVIRNVERDISDADLVKSIRETGSVIIVFDGVQVSSYNRMGPGIVRCYLYKRLFEVCSKCTRVGYRAQPNWSTCAATVVLKTLRRGTPVM
ncbi:hypothetical protein MTO96_031468 [Rhipicephalus appendiculatus]